MFGEHETTPLLVALSYDNLMAAKVLIEAGANYFDALTGAAFRNKRYIVEFLVKDCGANIDIQDDKAHTPLLYAVCENNYNAVKLLLSLGADINFKIDGKFALLTFVALIIEIESGKSRKIDSRIIRTLMNAGAEYGEALLLSVRIGNTHLIDQLLRYGADINARWGANKTPLSMAILRPVEEINPKMIEFLAKRGADVNEIFDDEDETITTPLNIAIAINRPDIVRILLKYGADPNHRDCRERTPLFYSVIMGNKISRLLLSYGADPNLQDASNRTPLMLALIDGGSDGDVIKSLLEFGADPNIQDKEGLTALMWSIISNTRETEFMIEALIRTGGFRAKGWETWYAISEIYVAAKREMQLHNINILLKNGTDLNIRNQNGMTALSYAITNFDDEITEMLLKAGAKHTGEKT